MGNVLVITEGKYKNCHINLEVVLDSRRKPIDLFLYKEESLVGNIYVGRVEQIIKNINAAFIKITPEITGFLPLDNINPFFVKKQSKNKELVTGDLILVSVIRDKIKTKEVALSTTLTFHSDYFVLDTSRRRIGVSKKIEAPRNKELRSLIESELEDSFDLSNDLLYDSTGFDLSFKEKLSSVNITARTISKDIDDEVLKNDFSILLQEYQDCILKLNNAALYTCVDNSHLHYENLLKRYNPDNFDKIVTDSSSIYDRLITSTKKGGLKLFSELLELYNDDYDLWKLYSIESLLDKLTNKEVYLKSGASLVIEQTEALTVVDVNSGKNIKTSNKDTAFQINTEAAVKIMQELRLRNISGIVVIDFINMTDSEKKSHILNLLRKEALQDANHVKVYDYTALDLVELTRSKSGPSLYECINR